MTTRYVSLDSHVLLGMCPHDRVVTATNVLTADTPDDLAGLRVTAVPKDGLVIDWCEVDGCPEVAP